MVCTTMDGNETERAAPAPDDVAHRRLVRTLVVACLVGGAWLAARDFTLAALVN
jgi:hypothetical protein